MIMHMINFLMVTKYCSCQINRRWIKFISYYGNLHKYWLQGIVDCIALDSPLRAAGHPPPTDVPKQLCRVLFVNQSPSELRGVFFSITEKKNNPTSHVFVWFFRVAIPPPPGSWTPVKVYWGQWFWVFLDRILLISGHSAQLSVQYSFPATGPPLLELPSNLFERHVNPPG